MPRNRLRSIRTTLAENMRRLRLERQLSQEALALRAGIHRNYVSGIERRQRNVGIDNVERIAKALGVTVPELLASQ